VFLGIFVLSFIATFTIILLFDITHRLLLNIFTYHFVNKKIWSNDLLKLNCPLFTGVFLTPLLAVWIMGAGKGISLVGTLRKLGKHTYINIYIPTISLSNVRSSVCTHTLHRFEIVMSRT
jgi:hypothetical protein